MRWVLFTLLFGAKLEASDAWKQVASTQDGITVRARIDRSAGQGETIALGVIRAPISRVWAVLADVARYQEFMPYMSESRLVRSTAAHVWQYCRTKTPVVSSRDYTLKFTMTRGRQGAPSFIRFEQDNAAGPRPKAGVVRVRVVEGSWELTSVDNGRATQAIYRLRTNPGGSVPLWLAHLGNTRAIPDIVRAVRRRARK